jgi:hypothetical protein
MTIATSEAAYALANELRRSIDDAVARIDPNDPCVPGHRVKFHWPPHHPVSYEYHVGASDWTESAHFEAHGETFPVKVARNEHGVFARCEELWHEARAATLEGAIEKLRVEVEPLFARQMAVARALGIPGRFTGHIRDLPPLSLLQLLFCDDRDVAHDAMTEIETHASTGLFLPSLLEILNDRVHPMRRSAQWCVLDLFEDLPSFAATPEEEARAVKAMASLLWDAEDDYCRTIYKAGVVLGGHVSGDQGGAALLSALRAPSRIGRRSAMHGLYHVVEWNPDMTDVVVWALTGAAKDDTEPVLRQYAADMARDIAQGTDHAPDPVFEA